MTEAFAMIQDDAPALPTEVVRAKILVQEPGVPVQLTLPAQDALDLVSIAEDFARSIALSDVEGDRLVDAAASISAKLRDCLAARAAS